MDGLSSPPPVLVIEDDRSIAQLVARVVHRGAWPVVAVTTAADALLHIAKTNYSAIVLDLMLPHGSGDQVIDVLRRERPDLLRRVIVMTASPSLLKTLESHDLAGTLVKPFDIDHLSALLKKAAGDHA
jgi:DNA-binding response OmpR family regulator